MSRIFNLAIILTIVLTFPLSLIQVSSQAKTQSQIDAEIAKTNATLSEVNKNLEDVSDRKDNLNDEVDNLNKQIEITQKAIDSSNNSIKDLDKKIEENKKKVEDLKSEMKVILRDLQTQKGVSKVQNILAAQNLGDVLSRMYTLSSTQSEADKIKEDIQKTTSEMENNKKKQEEVKQNSEAAKVLAQSKKDGVQQLLDQFRGKETEYAKQTRELKERQKNLNSESKQAQEEYKKQQLTANAPAVKSSPTSKSNGGSVNVGSGGCWFEDRRSLSVPGGFFAFPTSGGISQVFHCGHDGVDIASGSGTAIIASASGTVQAKGSFNIAGFGNWVALKHTLPSGQRLYTLYAHMISPSSVAVGSSVSQGQQIGGMGCTGSCTGTHLHFMIMSDTYESSGPGCLYGSAKCYNPLKFF
jgi:murein DD-endopeptidase MepM/ murein hydrolase activator NlpD